MNRRLFFALAGLALCLALIPAGCGKKAWPKPDAKGEALSLDQVTVVRMGECLTVGALVLGKAANLDRVVLELEKDGCPGCPFSPGTSRELLPGQGLHLDQNRLSLRLCGLAPGAAYRVRVLAHNLHSSLPPSLSPVLVVQEPAR